MYKSCTQIFISKIYLVHMSCKKIYTLGFICEMNKIPYFMSKSPIRFLYGKCREFHIHCKKYLGWDVHIWNKTIFICHVWISVQRFLYVKYRYFIFHVRKSDKIVVCGQVGCEVKLSFHGQALPGVKVKDGSVVLMALGSWFWVLVGK